MKKQSITKQFTPEEMERSAEAFEIGEFGGDITGAMLRQGAAAVRVERGQSSVAPLLAEYDNYLAASPSLPDAARLALAERILRQMKKAHS